MDAKTQGTPKTLDEALVRIYSAVPMCDLKNYGYAILKDFLSQRFGAAMLFHNNDPRIVAALSILFEQIVTRETKREG